MFFPCLGFFHAEAATMSPQQAVQEALASVEELSESSPKAFDWDTSTIYYPEPGSEEGGEGDGGVEGGGMPEGGGECGSSSNGMREGEGGGGSDSNGMPEGGGGRGGDGSGAKADEAGGVLSRRSGRELDWAPGLFAVFAMDATNPVSVLLGKIVEVKQGAEGNEALLEWYSPVRNARLRSKYGRGAWSPVFNPENPSEPDRSLELVDAACITFSTLLQGNKLPSAVWAAVAAQVPPPEDITLDESDIEEGEDQGDPVELGNLRTQQTEGARSGGEGSSHALPSSAGGSAPENDRLGVERRAIRVPLTAAFSRPRRGASSSA